jgi:hypothetical protein
MAKLLHIILQLRHDTISQIAARKLSRSHQLRTQAPALLLITEARRIIRREQHAAITSLGGTGALSLHTQYDVYLAAPDHLLSVRRSPLETASRYLHVATLVACNRNTSSHRNLPQKYQSIDGVRMNILPLSQMRCRFRFLCPQV